MTSHLALLMTSISSASGLQSQKLVPDTCKLTYEKCLAVIKCCTLLSSLKNNRMLSYRRETALQGALVLAKSGKLELGDNILRTL